MKLSLRVIISGLAIGGAERHLSQVLPRLVSRGYSIKVITLLPHPKDNFSEILENSGVTVIVPPGLTSLHKFPRVLRKILGLPLVSGYLLFDYIRDRRSITHYFLPEAYIVGMIAAILSFSRSPKLMGRRSLNYYQNKRPFLKFLERKLHRCLTLALGNSQSVIKQLREEGLPESKIRLIYNGIERGSLISNKETVRQNLGLENNTVIFICVANLISYKGHADLMKAFSLVKEKLPVNWHLLCVGRDEGLLFSLKKQANQFQLENNISWLGARTDVMDLFNASDIGLLCSHEEGFSNAILEGMAAGLPMVVTDVGGNAEAVVHNETGLVVLPQNPDSLSDAILALSTDPIRRERFGKAGLQRVLDTFSLDNCVSAYDQLYGDVCTPILKKKVA